MLNRGGKQDTNEDEHQLIPKRSRLGNYEGETAGSGNENFNNFNLGGAMEEKRDLNKKQSVNLGGLTKEYSSGQYCGLSGELKRSPKLNIDPIIELRHIIGYSPDRCLNLHWSRFPNDPNVVIFTSGGTLIAMDIENNS